MEGMETHASKHSYEGKQGILANSRLIVFFTANRKNDESQESKEKDEDSYARQWN